MAFTIIESREAEAGVTHDRMKHLTERFAATIPEPKERVASLDEGFIAEIDFHAIVRHETDLTKDDTVSGIFATDNPTIVRADGSVSNLLEIESGHVLIDIYIQNGPEFVAVESKYIGGAIPDLGTRIRLWRQGLKIYPTFT